MGTPALAQEMCDRTLDALILNRLEIAEAAPFNSLNDVLFSADAKLYRRLIQEILPTVHLLDPACGSGNLLVALHQRLSEIYSILTGYMQQIQGAQLTLWRETPADKNNIEPIDAIDAIDAIELSDSTTENPLQDIQKKVLRHNLYGVEMLLGASETTRFQLLLHTVATARHPQELEPLVDLTFNIMTGNSLIGFITVDEERFEQISTAGDVSILQGNLLQPLAADSYQTILAEKNLALEHYQHRNRALTEASNIPDYAMDALLRADILRLNAKAQHKLDRLLLNHMSQQLGIEYKAMQLTDKPQKQPLTLEDIDVLQPFHWGYHFSHIIKQGGFDAVLCVPPWGALKPTPTEFFQRFQDLAAAKAIDASTLKTSKRALATGDPEVTQAWLFYQNQYAYVTHYFYRSDQYANQNPTANGKPVRHQLAQERLFTERCFNLLAPNGLGAVVLPEPLSKNAKAKKLQQLLQAIDVPYDKLTGNSVVITHWIKPQRVGVK
ncbi:MAG: hypothetical protein HC800_21205 [Phormidesmis sp. RL_2_1]|nr:hypothetical protein [Phormidesmis sp. RL_2_1]